MTFTLPIYAPRTKASKTNLTYHRRLLARHHREIARRALAQRIINSLMPFVSRSQRECCPARPWSDRSSATQPAKAALNRSLPRHIIRFMLQPDFDPAPVEVRVHRCKYVSQCKARRCLKRATLVAEKVDVAGRHIRQIELCVLHCEVVIERERSRGLEISDRRNE